MSCTYVKLYNEMTSFKVNHATNDSTWINLKGVLFIEL